jgi:hypothetical protein
MEKKNCEECLVLNYRTVIKEYEGRKEKRWGRSLWLVC